MEKTYSYFPDGFFTKDIPEAQPSNDPDDEIIPIQWSDEVMSGKKIALVTSPKKNTTKRSNAKCVKSETS